MSATNQITIGRMLGAVALFAVTAALLCVARDSAMLRMLCSLLAFATLGLACGTPFGRPLAGLVGLIVVSFVVFTICLVSYVILSANGIVPIVD